jgi:hypothetical protein
MNGVKSLLFIATLSLFLSGITAVWSVQSAPTTEDLDPLVDITVTFKLQAIRSLEKMDIKNHETEWIDFFGKPDFYVKVFINGREFTSPTWRNTRYVYNPDWSATVDVPDDQEFVNITIQLWDWNLGLDKLCDLSENLGEEPIRNSYTADLFYSIKTGHWFGDDFSNLYSMIPDLSGYGRLCGCDDGSFIQHDRDCELWFDITQNDYDGDGIPYWTEANVFHTDPTVDNTGEDADQDGVPIEWEWKWGHFFYWVSYEGMPVHGWLYDPFVWEDHATLDPDQDALTNVEEYLTSQWGSDPFRKDLFIELDQMETSPDGKKCILPEGSKELLRTAHDRRNVVYHLDDGTWSNSGSEIIPFDESTSNWELQNLYRNYFLHGNLDNWRRGVFHYALVVYDAGFSGFVFDNDAQQISTSWVDKNIIPFILEGRDVAYASVFMHETGHTLGFNYRIPGHDKNSYYPWQLGFWKNGNYKSCMNYRYTYRLVDYSDGSHGKNDYDDWETMDFYNFQRNFD